MKKGLIVLAILIAVFISCIYIFIPSDLAVSRIIPAKSTVGGSYRYLSQEQQWTKWWPDSAQRSKKHDNMHGFSYGDDSFLLARPLLNSVEILIRHKNLSLI